MGNGVRRGGVARIFPKIQRLFPTNGSRDAWSSAGKSFAKERPWAGAALAAAFAFCEDQRQQRGSGVREARERIPGGCSPSAPLRTAAVLSQAPKGCRLRATVFPAIGRDFPTLVLFQPTLHLLFICGEPRCLGRVRTRRPIPHSGRAGRENLFLLII